MELFVTMVVTEIKLIININKNSTVSVGGSRSFSFLTYDVRNAGGN